MTKHPRRVAVAADDAEVVHERIARIEKIVPRRNQVVRRVTAMISEAIWTTTLAPLMTQTNLSATT